MELLDITAGSHLFCVAAPNLEIGTILSKGEFGRRHLDRPILKKETKCGEAFKSHYDLGPLASAIFDLEQPRICDSLDPIRAKAVLGELVWEIVRLREFAHRPSRLESMFFWSSEADAQHWYTSRTWPSSIYKVEVVESRRFFAAEIDKVQFSAGDGTLSAMMHQAHLYWSGPEEDSSKKHEILLEGAVRVIASIS